MGRLRISILVAAATLAAAAAAVAQDPAPPTAPACQGAAAGDARGDQRTTLGSAPETLDLTGAFFRTDKTTAGRLLTTANLQVARLAGEAPPGASAVSWLMHWRDGDTVRYASATVRATGETSFAFGRRDGSTYVPEGDTSGRLLAGEGGIVQIVLPESLSAPGERMTAPYAATQSVSDVAGTPVAEEADLAPDDAQRGGATFVVAECSPSGEAPVPEPGAPVPAPKEGSLEHAPPSVRVATRSANARFVRGRGRIFVRLRSTGPVTDLVGLLERGRREYGRGALKAMHGKGTLIVRLTRRVRKGRYRLLIEGRDGEDERVTTSGRIRLR